MAFAGSFLSSLFCDSLSSRRFEKEKKEKIIMDRSVRKLEMGF